MVEMLAREAARKIDAVFSQLTSVLLTENQSLKASVGRLESELKTATTQYENARMWRENVLNGCMVLFERSGLVFTLKPLGKLVRETDLITVGVTDVMPAVQTQSEQDAGEFPLKGKSNTKCFSCHLLNPKLYKICLITQIFSDKNTGKQLI